MKTYIKLSAIPVAILLLASIIVAFSSCNEEDQEPQQDNQKIDLRGTVDVKISQISSKDTSILVTEKSVYNNAGIMTKRIVTYDTVLGLGNVVDTLDTGRSKETQDGDEVEIDTFITHPKQYQFYISIKPNK